ncbi:MAG: twin-arginine translocase subunit TatC [Tepidisphaeraceae bacterium]
MTAVAPPDKPPERPFDPDDFRMTVGEHLEELRRRVVLALLGWAVAVAFCLSFGNKVIEVFCRPLSKALAQLGLNPQIHFTELGEGFLVWIEVNLITAAALASPWIVHQLWLFVAAGLYPRERKYITRYAPLSIGLLIGGMAFVYFLVLPWSIIFFLDFATDIPLPHSHVTTTQPHAAVVVPSLPGDPAAPQDNEMWIDSSTGQIKIFFNRQIRAIRFSSQNLLVPDIRLADYIDLVTGMLLTFGLSFQLPLIVLALVRIGIVEIDQLKAFRRYVYFVIAILAAAITPGDIITATVLLMIPLIFLYELGIWLARIPAPRPQSRSGL